MAGAGLVVESAKGECNLGQHEIAFRYDEALATCDNHVIYKNGAKEIAAQEGMSLTFMAKPNEREGNSCHIHFSLPRHATARSVDGRDGPTGCPTLGQPFVAGLLRYMRELTLLLAPNINSYKRYREGSFAPTALRWGRDNRTCALRLVGHGASLRVENRVPGGDVNPYLAIAAVVAAGLHGIEQRAGAGAGVRRATPTTTRTPTTCRPRCATRWTCGGAASSPATLRRRGGRPLRQQGRGRAGRLRRGGHRLGAVRGFERL